jgi:aryl sulfotransferase
MTAAVVRPERRHVYQNHHLDSTRWDYFRHRPGDIVISTSYKTGTTWMQTIVAALLDPGSDSPLANTDRSPWLDARWFPLELVLNQLAAQSTRRFIKTHLPLDGLPFYDDAQYIVVARDPRDVFMSLLNHWGNHTPMFYQMINSIPGRVGEPLPEFDGDVPKRFRDWITRGWFEWESDGYPYWSHLHHCATWWEFRHLPNVRLVHYADLLADLDGEMRGIADWLGVDVPESRWPHLVKACGFESMKRDAADGAKDMEFTWKGGSQTFFNKGTNGRWRNVLTEADLELYATAMQRLPKECARWLENGGPVR